MNVHLLYADREGKGEKYYYDTSSIINDLGLENLFRAASRDQERSESNVQLVVAADSQLSNTLKKVMMIPLHTWEEISYRQEIRKDCFNNEAFIKGLYTLMQNMMKRWEKLGKKEMNKPGARDRGNALVVEVKLTHLFVNTMSEIKKLCRTHEKELHSEGLLQFCREIYENFSDEYEEKLHKILTDISFFNDGEDEYSTTSVTGGMVRQAKLVLECNVDAGLKLGKMKLETVETQGKKFKKLREKKTMMEKVTTTFASEPTTILKSTMLLEDLSQMQAQIVRYILGCIQPFRLDCRDFFENLYEQCAFYRACYNLHVRNQNLHLQTCFPTVCETDHLKFDDLMEYSMTIYRDKKPVGNTCDIQDKMLLIVTGANQGGKSTFLRSIGVAQVMLQCGMFVSAKEFQSGIFPNFFTHFTRREDSAMNSGRLDEELQRIDGIIRHLGPDSVVLLNESFATTTEEEGSVIAYDVIKAMVEAGVKVLTVTHLLSFAKQVYAEERSHVEFLSAERKEGGYRTYKMIQTEPELTSFGLDLYEQVLG